MYCKDDSGNYYEPYGSFNIEQDGKMTEVFKIPDGTYVKNDHTKTFDILKTITVGGNYIAISVNIWEDDNIGDDLIGRYYTSFHMVWDKYHDRYEYGDDGSFIHLKMDTILN